MKVIIAGSRDFTNYNLLKAYCDYLFSQKKVTCIVCGGARGADKLGARYARENKIPVKLMEAKWELHGKSAGYIRNEQMALYADALVAFWDGNSKGTKHMIDLANKHDLPVRVKIYA